MRRNIMGSNIGKGTHRVRRAVQISQSRRGNVRYGSPFKAVPSGLIILLIAPLLLSCSVMSKELKDQAIGQPPFKEIVQQVQRYRGDTVIVGGYVIKVENKARKSIVEAVQAPLKYRDEPGAKDLSQGRLVITVDGFLDPEVYTKNRKITVAGKVTGSSEDTPDAAQYPFLRVDVLELYLWPISKASPNRYPYDDPFYPFGFPWYWYRPYHHHRWW